MNRYICSTHGEWDANKASGCPECVIQLRLDIKNLSNELQQAKNVIDNTLNFIAAMTTATKLDGSTIEKMALIEFRKVKAFIND